MSTRLVLLVICLQAVAVATARQIRPGYQTLVLDGSSGESSSSSASALMSSASLGNREGGDRSWVMEISSRDSRLSPFRSPDATHEELLTERLKRDSARVAAILARLKKAVTGFEPDVVSDFSGPLESGLSDGSGEYFAHVGVGTPAKFSYVVIDTGSDLSWLQCTPCGSCYNQSDPIFNPSLSSSYKNVDCANPLCAKLDMRGCQSTNCLYEVSYGDGSFTLGNFATETLTFGSTVVPGVAIGCGHDNEGLFVGAAGLLGLGQGATSFVSQIASDTNRMFSYCLPDRQSGSASSLVFGRGSSIPAGTVFAPLLQNPRLGTFYYLPLDGISVSGTDLSISPSAFDLSETGSGGVIIDSGTSVTRLTVSVYSALREAFKAAAAATMTTSGSFSLFDTCFNLGGKKAVDVPTVDLHFKGGATLSLPASNYLIPVDTSGTYCFAFAPTSGDISIIGNLQQQTYRVLFDTAASRVGFSPKQC